NRYPHGESNPGFRTENPTSWATRRWGRVRADVLSIRAEKALSTGGEKQAAGSRRQAARKNSKIEMRSSKEWGSSKFQLEMSIFHPWNFTTRTSFELRLSSFEFLPLNPFSNRPASRLSCSPSS